MRGKLVLDFQLVQLFGITPARAGKTRSTRATPRGRGDHPRACGENSKQGFSRPVEAGSPPRVRGKHRMILQRTYSLRITPARAGKTTRRDLYNEAYEDHPRACGENRRHHLLFFQLQGSPPRVRGKPREDGTNGHIRRITPARAGKTIILIFRYSRHGDHPRACGENNTLCNVYTQDLGSPPRVRGKLGFSVP